MTTLSNKGDADGSTSGHDQGMFKTAMGKIWQVIADLLGTDSGAMRSVHEQLRANGPGTLHNISLVPTVGSNALTMTVKTRAGAVPSAADPVLVGMRNATLATGDSLLRHVTSGITGVISSGSTMGHASGVAGAIYWYLVDSDGAGAMKLAFTSTYYGPALVGTTVAEGGAGAADSASAIYSDGAYANKAMRLVGRTTDTQTTAGTWAALPSAVELWPFDPVTVGVGVMGQCRLTKSGSNLILSPLNGNLLTVNGTNCTVPDGGTVSLAPTGLQPVLAITNRAITSNVATLTHSALSAAIPVGASIAVRDVGGASAYNGLKTVTASSTTTTSYAAVAANEGTTADTGGRVAPIYYIYATASAGAVNALEASTTAWAISTTAGNKGVPIKSGDNTRTLVGMAMLIAGPAWADSAAQRFVLTYWGRRSLDLTAAFTAGRAYASSAWGEPNTEIRNEFLTWGDESVQVDSSGPYTAAVAGSSYAQAIGIDGLTPEDGASMNNDAAAGQAGSIHMLSTGALRTLAEGYHYATLLANHSGGSSGTYTGGAAGNARCAVRTLVRG